MTSQSEFSWEEAMNPQGFPATFLMKELLRLYYDYSQVQKGQSFNPKIRMILSDE